MNTFAPLTGLLTMVLLYLPVSTAQANPILIHYNSNLGTGQNSVSSTNTPTSHHFTSTSFTDNVSLNINKDISKTLTTAVNVNAPGSTPGQNPGHDFNHDGHDRHHQLFFTSTLGIPTSDAFYYYQYETPYRNYRWLATDGGYWPDDATVGGYDDQGSDLYICKTYYGDGMYVGQQADGYCKIAYHGTEVDLDARYGVLAGSEFKWLLPTSQNWVADHSPSVDGKSYVCRVHTNDGIYPGQLSHDTCHFVYHGKANESSRYEVLTTVPSAY